MSIQLSPSLGRVSIIMPARNAEKYIGSTLKSIADQSYENWELIVVEDGSEDATESIVNDFRRRHPGKVVYSRNPTSLGAGQTRNIAFGLATGQYHALLDSDDRWLYDHLERSVEGLTQTNADIVYSTVRMVQDGTDEEIGTWGPTPNDVSEFPASILGRSFVTPSATVMKREVICDVGPWSSSHRYCEDYDFWLRCIAKKKKFAFLDGIRCLYRKNHAGATTEKLCGTLEEVALTTEAYRGKLDVHPRLFKRYAAESFRLAARFHRDSSPAIDPSADATRTGRLFVRGWQMQPTRIDLLLKGIGEMARRSLRSNQVVCTIPAPEPFGTSRSCEPPKRVAA